MSEIQRDEGAQKVQDQPAPPTEAPPASEATKPEDGQGGLKEVGLEELLERAKLDAPGQEAGGKQEQGEVRQDDNSRKDNESAPAKSMSILEKARQLLEQESRDAEEKAAASAAQPVSEEAGKDTQQEAAAQQDVEQDKAAPQIGDTQTADKGAEEAEKKEGADAKEDGKQMPGDVVQKEAQGQEVPVNETKNNEEGQN